MTDLGAGKFGFMDLRKPLSAIGPRLKVDFAFSPVPHYMIKNKGRTIVITNVKNAEDWDFQAGNFVMGDINKV